MTNVHTGHPDLYLTISADPDDYSLIQDSFRLDDEEETAATVRELQRKHREGDVWAWASVTLSLEYYSVALSRKGFEPIAGEDQLGACSYASAKEFVGYRFYFDDMLDTAINSIKQDILGACPELLKEFEEAVTTLWMALGHQYPKHAKLQ